MALEQQERPGKVQGIAYQAHGPAISGLHQGQGVLSRCRGGAGGFLQDQTGEKRVSGGLTPVLACPGQGPVRHGPGLSAGAPGTAAAGQEHINPGIAVAPEVQGVDQAQPGHPAGFILGIKAGA